MPLQPRRTLRKKRTHHRRDPLRHFNFERLEERRLLAAESLNDESLVNDLIVRVQTTWESGTSVAISNAGAVVAFSGKGPQDDQGVFAKKYDAQGAPLGQTFQVNSTRNEEQHSAVVAASADGSFAVAWTGRGNGDQAGVFFQRFDALAQPLGGETLVNTTVGGVQDQPAIAMAPDGQFVIAWHGVGEGDAAGIFQRRFDANAAPMGSETSVVNSHDDQQAFPAVALDEQGRALVSWSSRHQDGSDWGVYGRVFGADGQALSDEFAVNSTTIASQIHSQVAVGATHEFVIGWSSFAQDGDGWGVYARRFSADGVPLSAEKLVPADTDGNQQDVSLAVGADGAVLAAWSSGIPDGSGWETFARALTLDLEPDGDPIPLNQTLAGANSGHQQFTAAAMAPLGTAAVVFSGNGVDDHGGVFLAAVSTGDGIELATIADQTINELAPFTVTAAATTNGDQAVTYSLERAPSGATIDPDTGVIAWTPTEQQGPGVYPFTVIAALTSQPTRRAKEVFIVTVDEVNQPPILNFIGDRTIAEGQLLTFAASATDNDSPSQRLVYRLGDGAPTGASIDPLSGAFRWTPDEIQGPGEYQITVIVSDLSELQATDREVVTVTVTEANQAPTLSPIGDLSLPHGGTLVVALTAVDPDVPANTLTFRGDTLPTGATVDPSTGVVRWVPTEEQFGQTHAFAITVLDNGTPQLSDSIDFQVNVADDNQAPSLDPIDDATADEGSPFTVTATASDPEDQTLTFSLENAPDGATIEPNTGEINWTPSEEQGPGQHVFTVKVTDTGAPALSDLTVFKVTVGEVNTAPSITPIENVAIDEQVEWTLAVVASDADLPANLLTYSLLVGPTGAAINALTGVITWTPTEAQGPGDHSFSVQVSDNVSPPLTATTEFVATVREVNRAPQLSAVPPQTIRQGEDLVLVLTADDPDRPLNALTFTIEGEARGAQIASGSAPHTADFRWTPGFDVAPGDYDFAIRVGDGGSPLLEDTVTLQVTVTQGDNQPPSFVSGPAPTLDQNSGLHRIPNWATQISAGPASESDQELMFVVGVDLPELFESVPSVAADGTLSFTPQLGAVGVAQVTVQLKDNGGTDGNGVDVSPITTFAITIEPCAFDVNLTGWRVAAEGGSPAAHGTVGSVDCRAELREGDSTVVELEQSFVVPAGVSTISFRYDALALDSTATDSSIDAFEAALVDAAGASLVPTYTNNASQDAFFRFDEGANDPSVGSGTTVANGLVTVSVADIAPDTAARLILRLVNDDADVGSSVQIVDVTLPSGVTPTSGASTAKFFVADQVSRSVFAYDIGGNNVEQFSANPITTDLRGIAANAAGTLVWTIDGTSLQVQVCASDGTSLGAWQAAGLESPTGIANSNLNLWIVDSALDKAFFYPGATVRRTGEAIPTLPLSFDLDPTNTSPSDVAAAGANLWVVDDVVDKVFVYSLSGDLLNSWTLDARNADPSGLTLDPTGASQDAWIVDRVDNVVYRYADARTITTDALTASDSFPLSTQNGSPEGIADPPVGPQDAALTNLDAVYELLGQSQTAPAPRTSVAPYGVAMSVAAPAHSSPGKSPGDSITLTHSASSCDVRLTRSLTLSSRSKSSSSGLNNAVTWAAS